MSGCDLQTALNALMREHLKWEDLHPRTRARLLRAGYDAGAFWGQKERVEHLAVLQPFERMRGSWR